MKTEAKAVAAESAYCRFCQTEISTTLLLMDEASGRKICPNCERPVKK